MSKKLSVLKKSIFTAGIALLTGSAVAADFYLVVPMKGRTVTPNITVALNAYAVPAGTVGSAYNFDFKNLLLVTGDQNPNLNQVTFSLAGGVLPPGLAVDAAGVVTGTPSEKNLAGSSFQLQARYKSKSGEQLYTIVVDGVALKVKALVAGHRHACALTLNNGVKCWGDNYHGQVGDNTTTERHTPVDVYGLTSGVTAITAGGAHTCALLDNGGIKCWGYNAEGQLGNNTTASRSGPTAVSGLSSGVASVHAGGTHTCALMLAGGLKCWGEGTDGRLGNGSTSKKLVPTDVTGLTSDISMVSIGVNNTCVVTTTGGAKCWGLGLSGQLGNGGFTSSSTPVDVYGLTNGVRQISVGGWFICAATTANTVKCWGQGGNGRLGDGTENTSAVPVDVIGLPPVSSIALGVNTGCALTSTGGAMCWGGGRRGQLGNNKMDEDSFVPVAVQGLTNGVTSLTGGSEFTCAVVNGDAKCWGFNGYGELGQDSTADTALPRNVQP